VGRGLLHDPGKVLGWAVGPQAGDAGNWGSSITVTVKFCFPLPVTCVTHSLTVVLQ
jgi:hypothetical protein